MKNAANAKMKPKVTRVAQEGAGLTDAVAEDGADDLPVVYSLVVADVTNRFGFALQSPYLEP